MDQSREADAQLIIQNGSADRNGQAVEHYVSALPAALGALPLREPDYNIKFGWASNYDAIFSRAYTRETERSAILQKALSDGRVLVCGRGGSGKTTTLHHLAREAHSRKLNPVLVDLRPWSAEDTAHWAAARLGASDRAVQAIGFALTRFAVPQLKLTTLIQLTRLSETVVLLDGLNEAAPAAAEAFLTGFDRLVGDVPRLSIVAADRIVRRLIRSEAWAFCSPLPLPNATTSGEGMSALLELPFFLDSWKAPANGANRSAILERYVLEHGGVNSDDLNSLGAACYAMYALTRSRTFQLDDFKRHFSEAATQSLIDARVLEVRGEAASFSHHLVHDYLAARFVALHPELWHRGTFAIISFAGSSFDSVALAFEQAVSPLGPDQFLKAVYDWNPYAAAYCIAEGRPLTGKLSSELRLAITGMIADRLHDPVLSTRKRAEDSIALIAQDQPQKAEDSIRRDIAELKSEEPWFQRWRSLYSRERNAKAEDRDIAELLTEDSVLGWTLANVLKRSQLSDGQEGRLREFVQHPSPTIRWRAVHVLGAFPNSANADVLFGSLLRDPDGLVRYGAARSLVEMARLDPKIRSTIVTGLCQHASQLLNDEPTVNEMASAFVLVEPPEGWEHAALVVARAFYRAIDDPVKGERWLEFGARASAIDAA